MTSRFDLHESFIQSGIYLRNWSPRTVRTYRQGLSVLGIERPTKVELDAWVIRLRERNVTPGGCNMSIRSINSYLTSLHSEGHTLDTGIRIAEALSCERQPVNLDHSPLVVDGRVEGSSSPLLV